MLCARRVPQPFEALAGDRQTEARQHRRELVHERHDCFVSTDGPTDDRVRARKVTIRSAIGFWTTNVCTNDDAGSVASRWWCGSKSATGEAPAASGSR